MEYQKHGLKAKTIKAIIRKKINNWLATIEDEDLRKACEKEVIVTGGCIASMLLGEQVNDFDLYFRKKSTIQRLADYYIDRFLKLKKEQGGVNLNIFREDLQDSNGADRVRIVVKSAGVASTEQESDYEYFEGRPDHEAGEYVGEAFDPLSDAKDLVDADTVADPGPDYDPIFLSTNAISLRGKIQLILRFFGDPEEIHANYDFAHCTNYWSRGELVLKPAAMEALLTRELVYHGSRYPLCSIIRTRKFIERGWRVNAGQYLKMVLQLNELDLNDYQILEEQLTGVDVAYFTDLLQKAKDKHPDRVDSAYITEIIDRMF